MARAQMAQEGQTNSALRLSYLHTPVMERAMLEDRKRRIDQFFLFNAARADSWRNIAGTLRQWVGGHADARTVQAAVGEVAVIEQFHAFPGPRVMQSLTRLIERGDANGAAALARCSSVAVLGLLLLPCSLDCTSMLRKSFPEDIPIWSSITKEAQSFQLLRFEWRQMARIAEAKGGRYGECSLPRHSILRLALEGE
jgi:hypothetical protein